MRREKRGSDQHEKDQKGNRRRRRERGAKKQEV
jgi:hypothetical protein